MLCESTWVKNKTESLPESQYIIISLEMLWFWWICCMMQKLKSKSNSVNIHTGHPVFWQEFTVLMIFCKMGCQCGSFFEWNKASLLVTWLVKTPLASICSEWASAVSTSSFPAVKQFSCMKFGCSLKKFVMLCESFAKSSAMAWKNVKRKRPIASRFLECLKASMLVWDAGDVVCSLLVSSCSCCSNNSKQLQLLEHRLLQRLHFATTKSLQVLPGFSTNL